MRLAIHQPNYLPYLGFFHKMLFSDVYVILDTVQFVKSGPLAWMNRNKIRTREGWMWLTVPVLTKGMYPVKINNALIDNSQDWRRKHLAALTYNYEKAAYFNDYIPFFRQLYNQQWEKLSLLNEQIIKYLFEQLDISVKLIKASELNIQGKASQLLINICKEVGADEYIYGKHGEDYMDFSGFQESKIKLSYQDFNHPQYRQLYEPFIQDMSVIDLLFNEGKNSSRILREIKAK